MDNVTHKVIQADALYSAGAVGEGKFATPIDVIVPHTADSVTVGFGSTVRAPWTHMRLDITVSSQKTDTGRRSLRPVMGSTPH